MAWDVLDEPSVLKHLPDDLEGSRHHIVSDVDSAMWLLACYPASRQKRDDAVSSIERDSASQEVMAQFIHEQN